MQCAATEEKSQLTITIHYKTQTMINVFETSNQFRMSCSCWEKLSMEVHMDTTQWCQ